VAMIVLRFPPGLEAIFGLLLRTAGTIVVAWLLYNAVDVLTHALGGFARSTESEVDDNLVPLVRKLLRVVIVALAVVMVIQQWGYDVTSLIAGLGLGGLAFALAAKDTLSNWFGSVMIFTDRPFKLGDWIKSSHGEGVVEEIGLRSTKIRTFDKSLIAVPNSDIATTSIENFSEMPMRRLKTQLGLTCATTKDQIEWILEELRRELDTHEMIEEDSWRVHFVAFGASTLDLEISCFVKTTSYAQFLDVQQGIFFRAMEIIEEAGSGLAFPSQSIYFENPLPVDREPWEIVERREVPERHSETIERAKGDEFDKASVVAKEERERRRREREERRQEIRSEGSGAGEGDGEKK
jgi:MscS family membrane protein